MSPTFKKLNLGSHSLAWILSAPPSFEPEIKGLQEARVVRNFPGPAKTSFVLAFVKGQPEVEKLAGTLEERAPGDAVVWLAYPKGGSKRFKSELNRDQGWEPLKKLGFDTVRQIAIDEDWSALRFRRAEFIGK
jgi:hypothetical protein